MMENDTIEKTVNSYGSVDNKAKNDYQSNKEKNIQIRPRNHYRNLLEDKKLKKKKRNFANNGNKSKSDAGKERREEYTKWKTHKIINQKLLKLFNQLCLRNRQCLHW